MEVNPVGIQSYQQINRRENTPVAPNAEQKDQASKTVSDVTISPQEKTDKSPLAVKQANGSYADKLSVEEQRALDILFSRFQDAERFGSAYSKNSVTEETKSMLGKIVDLKA